MRYIKPLDFYIFRRPLLPVNQLFDFLHRALEPACFGEQLRSVFSQPALQESIYLASPNLYNRLQNWLEKKDLSDKKLTNTLFKYLFRSGTRCTPYGMFAGCMAPGRFNQATSVSMNCETPYTNHLHLDMKSIKEIVDFVNAKPTIKGQCRFYPNDTLYQVGDKYRYIFRQFENDVPHYAICSIDASIYLSSAVKTSEKGATIHQLASMLTRHEVTFQQAKDFIDLLC